MSSTAYGDPAPAAAPPDGGLEFEVRIVPPGLEATLAVRRDPPGSQAPVGELAVEQAAAALRRAGVIQGLDRAAVGVAVAAADGVPRVVARGTAPEPPVDAAVELIFANDVAGSPFHTVPAGTLLARRTPPSAGVNGVAVTGAPLRAAVARDRPLAAGAGARPSADAAGVIEIHAEIDGRPRMRGNAVAVDDIVTVRDIGVGVGAVRVLGGLNVLGDVVEGSRVSATGRLMVSGIVDHAHLLSDRGIVVGGACMGSRLRAGALQGHYRRLLAALGEADGEVAALCDMSAQLTEQAAAAGRRISAGRAMAALLPARFAGLGEALGAAASLARASADELPPAIVAALVDGAGAIEGLTGGEEVAPERMAELAACLTAARGEMERAAAEPADISASYLQACRVEAGGGLTLTGGGTYNTDIVVGGDLRAEASGATVRGGELRVGGRVRVRELGAPGGARVVVVLEGPLGGADRLRAGVAHAGAEVVVRGRRLVVEAKTLNLAVGCDEENDVVRSGVIAD